MLRRHSASGGEVVSLRCILSSLVGVIDNGALHSFSVLFDDGLLLLHENVVGDDLSDGGCVLADEGSGRQIFVDIRGSLGYHNDALLLGRRGLDNHRLHERVTLADVNRELLFVRGFCEEVALGIDLCLESMVDLDERRHVARNGGRHIDRDVDLDGARPALTGRNGEACCVRNLGLHYGGTDSAGLAAFD